MAVSRSDRTTIGDYLRFFRTHAGRGVLLYLIISLVASYVDGLSFTLFLPLLTAGGPHGDDALSGAVGSALSFLHVPSTPRGVIPLLVIFFALKGLLTFWVGARQYGLSTQMTRNLRARLVRALASAEYAYIQAMGPGELSNLVHTEAARAVNACLYVSRLLPLVLNLCVFSAIVTYLNSTLSAVAALCGLVAFFALRIPGRLTERASRQVTRSSAKLNGLLIELVEGYRYLRGTGSFHPVEHHIRGAVDRQAEATRHIGVLYSTSSALTQPLVALCLGGLIYFYDRAGHSLAPLLVELMYLYRILTDLLQAQTWWQEARSYAGGVAAVRDTLAKLDEHAERTGAQQFDHLADQIELRDVRFTYGERLALRGIGLTIPHKHTVALVGESGAGKSTIVDLLCGTLRPESGAILVDGTPLRDLDVESYRQRIGYVPQSSVLFEDTVENNITLWAAERQKPPRVEDVERAAQDAQCSDFIESLPRKYQTMLSARGENLSGGQRQRLAIARELYKQPDLLILDEATSALDAESEAAIRRGLARLKGRITVVIVTHRLASALDADRIYVLREGKVIEEGAGPTLLADPTSWFRRMYDQQQQGVST